MKRELPSRPSLEYLRKEAKDLLSASRSGDPAAQDRLRAVTTSGKPSLHHAQLALAREYGFDSWREMVWKIRTAETDGFLEAVCGDRWDSARYVQTPPEAVRMGNVYVAAACGDAASLRRHLQADPSLVSTPGGTKQWVPLLYLCFSRLNSRDMAAFAEAAEVLLQAGADPNAYWEHPAYENSPLSALYGACGSVYNPMVAEVLIRHGANVNDGESLYHSTESRNHNCLKLLLRSGAKIDRSNALPRMLDHDDVEGLRLMLEAKPSLQDPLMGESPIHHAIRRGRGRRHLDLLLEYGYDAATNSLEGWSAYDLAVRSGNLEAAQWLKDRGLAGSSPKDMFMEAALRGDEVAARATGVTLADLEQADFEALPEAAWQGHLEAVRAMLKLGFPVNTRATDHGKTALHSACWTGRSEVVRLLLEHDADTTLLDRVHNGTPIGWAMHGSEWAKDGDGNYLNPAADYYGVVAALLEAGSLPPQGDPPNGSDEAVLAITEWRSQSN